MRPQHVWERHGETGWAGRLSVETLSKNTDRYWQKRRGRCGCAKITAEHFGIYSIIGECGVKAAPPLYNTGGPALMLIWYCLKGQMKLHGGPNLARGPEFDTHGLSHCFSPYVLLHYKTKFEFMENKVDNKLKLQVFPAVVLVVAILKFHFLVAFEPGGHFSS